MHTTILVSPTAQGAIESRGHDYDPEWDFELMTPNKSDRAVIDAILEVARVRLLPALGIDSFSFFCVEEGEFGEGTVGRYISGTSSSPVIGLDLEQVKVQSRMQGILWRDQIKATVAHELAHALEEVCGCEAANEDAVENFARDYVVYGMVNIETLKAEILGDDIARARPSGRLPRP